MRRDVYENIGVTWIFDFHSNNLTTTFSDVRVESVGFSAAYTHELKLV